MSDTEKKVIKDTLFKCPGQEFRIDIDDHRIEPQIFDAAGKHQISGVIAVLGFHLDWQGMCEEFKAIGTCGQKAQIHLPYLDRTEIYPIEIS
jgi:hypothetical protein